MAENKVRSARLTPEIQEALEAYEKVFGWDFGQTVTQLVRYRERMMQATKGLDYVRNMSGSDVVIVWEKDSDIPEMDVDSERLAVWFIDECSKSIAEGFRDSAHWSAD